MNLASQLRYVGKHLMGHKEVDGIIVNDVCERGGKTILALQTALAEIAEMTSKRQLPITFQINEIANAALVASGHDPD